MKPLSDFPRETWKRYRVYYTGGVFDYSDIDAPNKTYARLFVGGELRPGLKVTKIVEVKAS